MKLKLIITFFIVILFASCKQSEQNNEILHVQTQEAKNESEARKVKENILKNFTFEDVARYTIASVMGQSAKIIKVTKNKDFYFVSYIRKSDKQKFGYKVKFDGNLILWASIDGRWRNSKYDERISYEEENNKLKIITIFSDGSEDIKIFGKGE